MWKKDGADSLPLISITHGSLPARSFRLCFPSRWQCLPARRSQCTRQLLMGTWTLALLLLMGMIVWNNLESYDVGFKHPHVSKSVGPDFDSFKWMNQTLAWNSPHRPINSSFGTLAQQHQQCAEWHSNYSIQLWESWGSFPRNMLSDYHARRCDELMSLQFTAEFVQQHPHVFIVYLNAERPTQVLTQFPTPSGLYSSPSEAADDAVSHPRQPVVALLVLLKTHSCDLGSADELFFIAHLLPSILQTLDPEFEYWLFPTFTHVDRYLNTPENLVRIRNAFERIRNKTLLHAAKEEMRRIKVQLFLPAAGFEWKLTSRKKKATQYQLRNAEGYAYNQAAAAAYYKGATWLFIIPDYHVVSTRTHSWAREMAQALSSFGPPYYGVVGSVAQVGPSHVLASMFLHRNHLDIFKSLFPRSLQQDFSLRAWISRIYGPKRTARLRHIQIMIYLPGFHSDSFGNVFHLPQCDSEYAQANPWVTFHDEVYLDGKLDRGRFLLDMYGVRSSNSWNFSSAPRVFQMSYFQPNTSARTEN